MSPKATIRARHMSDLEKGVAGGEGKKKRMKNGMERMTRKNVREDDENDMEIYKLKDEIQRVGKQKIKVR